MAYNEPITRTTSEAANNIFEELTSRHSGVLATIDKNCLPHITAVYYIVEPDFTIKFATKRQTLKHRNLTKHPDVQLLAYDEISLTTIQVTGKAYQIEDREEEQAIIEKVYVLAAENEYEAPPISKLYAGDYICYTIKPSRITMAVYLRPQKGGYDMFETIDFPRD